MSQCSQNSHFGDKFGVCSVCRRVHKLNKTGSVHTHGPQHDRCRGSGIAPSSATSDPRQDSVLAMSNAPVSAAAARSSPGGASDILVDVTSVLPSIDLVPDRVSHPVVHGPLLKHIPSAACNVCGDLLN